VQRNLRPIGNPAHSYSDEFGRLPTVSRCRMPLRFRLRVRRATAAYAATPFDSDLPTTMPSGQADSTLRGLSLSLWTELGGGDVALPRGKDLYARIPRRLAHPGPKVTNPTITRKFPSCITTWVGARSDMRSCRLWSARRTPLPMRRLGRRRSWDRPIPMIPVDRWSLL